MESSCADADHSFGPAVPYGCRGAFDFTLLFEEIFFSLIIDLILILAISVRLNMLHHAKVVASGSLLHFVKQCSACCYLTVQLVTLVLWSISSSFRTRLSIISAICNAIASAMVCILSNVEGTKSLRPSSILNIYLLGSSLFDIVQVRTFWLAGRYRTSLRHIAISSSIALALKVILLVLEAIPKKLTHEPASPEEKSGVYSLRTFWWLNEILWLGSHRRLESNDLFAIDSGLKTARYSSRLIDVWDKGSRSNKYALLRAVFITLQWPFLAPSVPRLILIGFNFAQPLLFKRALEFVQQGGQDNTGYGLIGATVLVYCGLAIFNGYYGHLLYRSITLIRGSLIDIIYHKSLTIDLSEAQQAAPAGLITADVERIDFTVDKIHSLWASVIEIGLGIFLLEREVGLACLAPVVVAIICTFLTSLVTKLLPERQKRWNQEVQKRVALTSTMLSNMKTVKMMGLSNHIASTLQNARMVELAASAAFRKFMAIINVTVLIPRQLSAPFTFMILVLTDQKGELSPSRAFTALVIIELITTPLGLFLQALPSVNASLACLDRIQKYLESPDRLDQCGGKGHLHNSESRTYPSKSPSSSVLEKTKNYDCSVVCFEHASVSYRATEDLVLNSISFSVSSGRIAMVVGPVACGKSSLLRTFLGELYIRTGEVLVRSPRVGYCDSKPWIPNGSIRACIIGANDGEFDKSWYDEVIRSCELEEDIRSLTDGSETAIGSGGIGLSEGQKQRLALARAIYSRAPLLLLDDVFRSLDLKTEMLLSRNLLSPTGLFKRYNFTVVFAAHSGLIPKLTKISSSTKLMAYSGQHLPIVDQIIVLGADGKLAQVGSFQELNAQDGYVQSLNIQPLFEEPENLSSHKNEKDNSTAKKIPSAKKVNGQEAHVSGTRDRSIYSFYLRPVGVVRIGTLLAAVIFLAFFTRFQRIWVQWWTEAHGQRQPMYIGVYFLLAVISCLSFTFFFWWMWMFVVPITAGNLHHQLLKSIIHSPLSYFTTVDSGVILNRFSQDAAIINGQLPVNLFQAISIAMICLIQIAFISYGSKYLAFAIPITLLVLGILSRFYLLTSQQLRILDIELKSPIYTCLTETKEGLATIRAFGWQSFYEKSCQSRIDESKRATYLLFMIQRWLNFVLDLTVAALATVLMTLAIELRTSTNTATFGVGLSSIIGFSTNISQFIVCYTEVENSLGAISRIKDCVESLKPEDSLDVQQPPPDWPSKGAIEFRNITASYNDNSNPALSDISFNILPGQKVLVRGRTGSGKSSLFSVILRLLDIQAGNVLIDDIDLSTLSAEAIRQSINIIPQSPFFLPGSVRLNLSLWGTQTDEDMIAALEKASLWEAIAKHGGLDATMSAIALSHGQQQLFCLTTAILKRSKVILIDEATSGVEVETEKRICEMIETSFRDCTVISITHKLQIHEDSDLVIVLSEGKLLE